MRKKCILSSRTLCVWCVTESRVRNIHDRTSKKDIHKQRYIQSQNEKLVSGRLSLSFLTLSSMSEMEWLMGSKRPDSRHCGVPSHTSVFSTMWCTFFRNFSSLSYPSMAFWVPQPDASYRLLSQVLPTSPWVHTHHEVGVKLHRVDEDFGGLEVLGGDAERPWCPLFYLLF